MPHRLSFLTAIFVIFFAALSLSAAERTVLQSPILFSKRFNYQGLHIYDSFYQWRPGGGIYVLENPADPPEKHKVRTVIDPNSTETLGEGIYSDPSLSFDAKKLLFCFKNSPDGNSTIYEIGIDGKGLRQITNLDKNGNPYKGSGGGHHDVKPAYLPDGRIVFCSTRYSGLVPCANNGVAILHIVNADGSDVHTISVNNVTEFDPAVLPDGRILFGRWEYIDKNALTIQSIWTVMPDGTNETALFANNMVFPEAVLQAKPVPGSDHLVVAAFTPHNSPPRGSIAVIDTRKGKNAPDAIFNFEHHDKPTFDRGNSCDPWALNENVIVYSGVPDAPDAPAIPEETKPFRKRNTPKLNAMMLIDREGNKTVVHSDPAIDIHNPIPVVPRLVPKTSADTTDRTKITGNFFVQNVYENMPQVPKGSVKYLRIIEETSRVSESPGGTWMNQTFSISAALAWSPKIFHGIVPVEEDGSVFFEVPAGRAVYFQLLDKDYRLVRSMRTFIQAAPGTTRSCVGCHEYGSAPRSAQTRIAGKEPRKPADESWGSGYVDYPSMIQPILDKKCVSCHGGEKGLEGGIDLTGGWTEYFCNSYETLTARREKQYIADLISGICCMNGTADWSCQIFEPYTHGSGKAPLANVILSEPHKTAAGLTLAEEELILAWIDTNGIYYGTWDYTASGPRLKEYAALRDELKTVMKNNRCTECHSDEKGEIKRFDNWINLERPEWSLILRAPLAAAQKSGGYGLALCRNRKVDQSFSRLGTMFKSGYAHSVLPLERFPSQEWQTWKDTHEGESVTVFASTQDSVYQWMLQKINAARDKLLQNPRVDMPNAAFAGKGITAGRSRQIIPQPLPETMPVLQAQQQPEGIKLSWERSSRTIGLIAEIHRGNEPNFKPTTETLLGRTERSEFFHLNPPAVPAYYAIVFVSDPAETCGTCKSGAVLNYNHSVLETVPTVKRIEDRCPLSTVVPMKSEPSWTGRIVL